MTGTTESFKMLTLPEFDRGLGQLEAYICVAEGVAFQMDNNLYWDSPSTGSPLAIQGVEEKKISSKFFVDQESSGKVRLKNWVGMCLAPVETRRGPVTFPVQVVPYSESPRLKFDVFYKDNKVAFRSYNGLFVGRVHRATDTLEATMFFPDETCFFRPLIGDLNPPSFVVKTLTPRPFTDIAPVPHLVNWQIYVNTTEKTQKHTFTINWVTQTTDKTFWPHLWGLGIPSSCNFSFWDAKPIVAYNQDNEHGPCVQRDVSEMLTKEVDVPSNFEAMALFFVDWHRHAFQLFTASICKTKPDGNSQTFTEYGGWMGLGYRNLRIDVKFRKLQE